MALLRETEKEIELKDFLNLFDNWNIVLEVNDNDLNTIYKGNFEDCKIKGNVVSFGFYDNELCVRIDR